MEGRPKDDSVLIARAQRGDTAAYEEIVQRYQQIAFRTAYVITGSSADAEDAAQEGFVKAYRALDRFRLGADLRPWLLRIVANEARNRVRSSGRRHQLELRLTEGFRPGDAAPSPEAVAVAADGLTSNNSWQPWRRRSNGPQLLPIYGEVSSEGGRSARADGA
ncbi:MAG: sigma-70 family RNA polymerase sigma factor [Chloroflexi bacterium]|nr:MAG: sigma-70 family RNA polymerase sigma factor [Chloroflexota bacterium]